MHLRTKSSQPGFIDARNRLVSSEVILPTNTQYSKMQCSLVMSVKKCLKECLSTSKAKQTLNVCTESMLSGSS